jgi:hypothetical protein
MIGTNVDNYLDITLRRGDAGNLTSMSLETSAGNECNTMGSSPLLNGTNYYIVAIWDTKLDELRITIGLVGGAITTYTSSLGGNLLSDSAITQLYLGSAVEFNDPDWDGKIDELRIWDRALDDVEIITHFNAGPDAIFDHIVSGSLILIR